MDTLEKLAFAAFDSGYADYWVREYSDLPVGFNVIHMSEELEDEYELTQVDGNTLKNGIQAMASLYPRHYANVGTVDEDAETADVYLQCCIFGDLIFG